MKRQVLKGTTSLRLKIFIADSSSTTGAGLTGLAYNSASLVWYYHRDDSGDAGGTSVTLATATRGTYTSGGFKEIDATNLPGWYEIGVPNAVVASGSNVAIMHLKGATNMAPLPIELELVSYDPNNATTLGLTNLDAAITSRLAPTTAGRTLDVSSGGEAGIDWANVGSPTTTVSLSGTTVGVSTSLTNAPSDSSGTTTLLSRLTDTRAGYLDNLSGGAVALASGVIVTTNNDKTGYSLTQTFPTNFASLGINASGHISRVVLCDTITTYTGDTPQTGDSFARIGTAGVGLTNLGDTRIANLDATVSSRLASASYTSPPSAATNASAVRTELATELGRIDVATSTRLATAGYTAPDNASIAAILVDTNELQTDWVNGGRLDLILDSAANNSTSAYLAISAVGDAVNEVNTIVAHLPSIDAGQEGGLLLAGTNTCHFSISDGVEFLTSTTNRDGFICQGNGTGNGVFFKSGTGSVAAGLRTQSYATNGHGLGAYASGGGNGFYGWGGLASGNGMKVQGGDTGGKAFELVSTSGDVVLVQSISSGHGIKVVAEGSNKNAVELTPGSGGTGINGTLYGLLTASMQAIADAFLGRRISGGASTGRTVGQALATIRNKVSISGSTLTVYDVDDTTPLYTATITSSSNANPITGIDPE